MNDSVSRFTRTVENYVKYRPSYPFAIVEFLQKTCQLTSASVIADVASGTGFLAEIFLKNGNQVIGVEPNPDMRTAGQHYLRDYPLFASVDATAEATTLESQSVAMITAGQAFHWFDQEKARREFVRILKPNGWVVLAWNLPKHNIPFMDDYEQIWWKYLAPPSNEKEASRQAIEDGLRAWYSPGIINFESFDNSQVVDFDGLRGRILSSSYSPTSEQPKYQPMLAELESIFRAHQVNEKVTIEYECRICYGLLQ
jgi:SAM-dependent methyltransferase